MRLRRSAGIFLFALAVTVAGFLGSHSFSTSAQEQAQCPESLGSQPSDFLFTSSKKHASAIGEKVDLIWSNVSGKVTRCEARDGFVFDEGEGKPDGKRSITVLNDVNFFSLECFNGNASLGLGNVCVDLSVEKNKSEKKPTVIFDASTREIEVAKSPVLLNWTVRNASRCRGKKQVKESASQQFVDAPTDAEWIRELPVSGITSKEVHPTDAFTRYIIECFNQGRGMQTSASVDVALVKATPPRVFSFSANYSKNLSTKADSEIVLRWDVESAQYCTGATRVLRGGFWQEGKSWTGRREGSTLTAPQTLIAQAGTTEYVLTCFKEFAYEKGTKKVLKQDSASVRVTASGANAEQNTQDKRQADSNRRVTETFPNQQPLPPMVALPAPPGNGTGLLGSYYSGWALPDFQRAEKLFHRVDGDIGYNSISSPIKGQDGKQLSPDTNFSVKWEGEIEPRYSERYTLSLSRMGQERWNLRMRLFINDGKVIDSKERQGSAILSLTAGERKRIRIELEHGAVPFPPLSIPSVPVDSFSVAWESPSQIGQNIPKEQLYPAQPPPEKNINSFFAYDDKGSVITFLQVGRSNNPTELDLRWETQGVDTQRCSVSREIQDREGEWRSTLYKEDWVLTESSGKNFGKMRIKAPASTTRYHLSCSGLAATAQIYVSGTVDPTIKSFVISGESILKTLSWSSDADECRLYRGSARTPVPYSQSGRYDLPASGATQSYIYGTTEFTLECERFARSMRAKQTVRYAVMGINEFYFTLPNDSNRYLGSTISAGTRIALSWKTEGLESCQAETYIKKGGGWVLHPWSPWSGNVALASQSPLTVTPSYSTRYTLKCRERQQLFAPQPREYTKNVSATFYGSDEPLPVEINSFELRDKGISWKANADECKLELFYASPAPTGGGQWRAIFLGQSNGLYSPTYEDMSYSPTKGGEYKLTCYRLADEKAAISKIEKGPPPPGNGTGLRAFHYKDELFQKRTSSRVDPQLDFVWADPPVVVNSASQLPFSIQWEGEIEPRFTDRYTLTLKQSEWPQPMKLFIDGALVVDSDRPENSSGMISFRAGVKRKIIVQYAYTNLNFFSKFGFQLLWESSFQERQVVPKEQLHPASLPPINFKTFRANRGSQGVNLGDAVLISWEVEQADSCTATARVFDRGGRPILLRWSEWTQGRTDLKGERIVTPKSLTEYTLTCIQGDDQKTVVSRSLMIDPRGVLPIRIDEFSGNGYSSDSQALYWQSNADECAVTGHYKNGDSSPITDPSFGGDVFPPNTNQLWVSAKYDYYGLSCRRLVDAAFTERGFFARNFSPRIGLFYVWLGRTETPAPLMMTRKALNDAGGLQSNIQTSTECEIYAEVLNHATREWKRPVKDIIWLYSPGRFISGGLRPASTIRYVASCEKDGIRAYRSFPVYLPDVEPVSFGSNAFQKTENRIDWSTLSDECEISSYSRTSKSWSAPIKSGFMGNMAIPSDVGKYRFSCYRLADPSLYRKEEVVVVGPGTGTGLTQSSYEMTPVRQLKKRQIVSRLFDELGGEIVWEGWIEPQKAGTHTFMLFTNNDEAEGVLTVNGITASPQTRSDQNGVNRQSWAVDLPAGTPLKFLFRASAGTSGKTKELQWRLPSQSSFVSIPTTQLYNDDQDIIEEFSFTDLNNQNGGTRLLYSDGETGRRINFQGKVKEGAVCTLRHELYNDSASKWESYPHSNFSGPAISLYISGLVKPRSPSRFVVSCELDGKKHERFVEVGTKNQADQVKLHSSSLTRDLANPQKVILKWDSDADYCDISISVGLSASERAQLGITNENARRGIYLPNHPSSGTSEIQAKTAVSSTILCDRVFNGEGPMQSHSLDGIPTIDQLKVFSEDGSREIKGPIEAGEKIQVRWKTTYATACKAFVPNQEFNPWTSDKKDLSGSQVLRPSSSASAIYVLECFNGDGLKVSDIARVEVNGVIQPAITTFKVERVNDQRRLVWSADADYCELNSNPAGNYGLYSSNHTQPITVTQTTEFTLSCERVVSTTETLKKESKLTITIPPRRPAGSGTGVLATFFHDPDFSQSVAVQEDGQIAYSDLSTDIPSFAGMNAFSAEWTGEVEPQYSGRHLFHVITRPDADLGFRLWVDDEKIIEHWRGNTTSETVGAKTLEVGKKVKFKLSYYQTGGWSSPVELKWSHEFFSKETIPTSQLYPAGFTQANGTGLLGEYFDDAAFTQLVARKVDPKIDYFWGYSLPHPSMTKDQSNDYSVRWKGFLQAPYTGEYTLSANVDENVRVSVNGTKIIDSWTNRPVADVQGKYRLQAGYKMPIEIEYANTAGPGGIRLYWSNRSVPAMLFSRIVESKYLYPADTPTRTAVGTGTGLRGSYYHDKDLSELAFRHANEPVNFQWGTSAPLPQEADHFQASRIGPDFFSAQWEGVVQPRSSGDYTFVTKADDGVRLRVREVPRQDQRGLQPLNSGRTVQEQERVRFSSEGRDGASNARERDVQFVDPGKAPIQGGGGPTITIVTPLSEAKKQCEKIQWNENDIVLDDWSSHAPREAKSRQVYMKEDGFHCIKLEYFEQDYGAEVSLSWMSDVQTKEIIPATQLYPLEVPKPLSLGFGSGLSGRYQSGPQSFSRVDKAVDFSWGVSAPKDGFPSDDFSVVWEGWIQPRYSGKYTLYTISDDGIRVKLSKTSAKSPYFERPLIEQWNEHAPRQDKGTTSFDLTAGAFYHLQVEYFEKFYGAEIKLMWSSDDQAKEVIPQSQLLPDTSASATLSSQLNDLMGDSAYQGMALDYIGITKLKDLHVSLLADYASNVGTNRRAGVAVPNPADLPPDSCTSMEKADQKIAAFQQSGEITCGHITWRVKKDSLWNIPKDPQVLLSYLYDYEKAYQRIESMTGYTPGSDYLRIILRLDDQYTVFVPEPGKIVFQQECDPSHAYCQRYGVIAKKVKQYFGALGIDSRVIPNLNSFGDIFTRLPQYPQQPLDASILHELGHAFTSAKTASLFWDNSQLEGFAELAGPMAVLSYADAKSISDVNVYSSVACMKERLGEEIKKQSGLLSQAIRDRLVREGYMDSQTQTMTELGVKEPGKMKNSVDDEHFKASKRTLDTIKEQVAGMYGQCGQSTNDLKLYARESLVQDVFDISQRRGEDFNTFYTMRYDLLGERVGGLTINENFLFKKYYSKLSTRTDAGMLGPILELQKGKTVSEFHDGLVRYLRMTSNPSDLVSFCEKFSYLEQDRYDKRTFYESYRSNVCKNLRLDVIKNLTYHTPQIPFKVFKDIKNKETAEQINAFLEAINPAIDFINPIIGFISTLDKLTGGKGTAPLPKHVDTETIENNYLVVPRILSPSSFFQKEIEGKLSEEFGPKTEETYQILSSGSTFKSYDYGARAFHANLFAYFINAAFKANTETLFDRLGFPLSYATKWYLPFARQSGYDNNPILGLYSAPGTPILEKALGSVDEYDWEMIGALPRKAEPALLRPQITTAAVRPHGVFIEFQVPTEYFLANRLKYPSNERINAAKPEIKKPSSVQILRKSARSISPSAYARIKAGENQNGYFDSQTGYGWYLDPDTTGDPEYRVRPYFEADSAELAVTGKASVAGLDSLPLQAQGMKETGCSVTEQEFTESGTAFCGSINWKFTPEIAGRLSGITGGHAVERLARYESLYRSIAESLGKKTDDTSIIVGDSLSVRRYRSTTAEQVIKSGQKQKHMDISLALKTELPAALRDNIYSLQVATLFVRSMLSGFSHDTMLNITKEPPLSGTRLNEVYRWGIAGIMPLLLKNEGLASDKKVRFYSDANDLCVSRKTVHPWEKTCSLTISSWRDMSQLEWLAETFKVDRKGLSLTTDVYHPYILAILEDLLLERMHNGESADQIASRFSQFFKVIAAEPLIAGAPTFDEKLKTANKDQAAHVLMIILSHVFSQDASSVFARYGFPIAPIVKESLQNSTKEKGYTQPVLASLLTETIADQDAFKGLNGQGLAYADIPKRPYAFQLTKGVFIGWSGNDRVSVYRQADGGRFELVAQNVERRLVGFEGGTFLYMKGFYDATPDPAKKYTYYLSASGDPYYLHVSKDTYYESGLSVGFRPDQTLPKMQDAKATEMGDGSIQLSWDMELSPALPEVTVNIYRHTEGEQTAPRLASLPFRYAQGSPAMTWRDSNVYPGRYTYTLELELALPGQDRPYRPKDTLVHTRFSGVPNGGDAPEARVQFRKNRVIHVSLDRKENNSIALVYRKFNTQWILEGMARDENFVDPVRESDVTDEKITYALVRTQDGIVSFQPTVFSVDLMPSLRSDFVFPGSIPVQRLPSEGVVLPRASRDHLIQSYSSRRYLSPQNFIARVPPQNVPRLSLSVESDVKAELQGGPRPTSFSESSVVRIAPGGFATLSWKGEHIPSTQSCRAGWIKGRYAMRKANASSGDRFAEKVTPSQSTIYTLTCVVEGNDDYVERVVSESVAVIVDPSLPSLSFAIPRSQGGPFELGGQTAVSAEWESGNATACAASAGWSGGKTALTRASETISAPRPIRPLTYTLSCENTYGTAVKSISIDWPYLMSRQPLGGPGGIPGAMMGTGTGIILPPTVKPPPAEENPIPVPKGRRTGPGVGG